MFSLLPLLCSKLAKSTFDFWSAVPLVQSLLPALRPYVSSPTDHVDDSFHQWKQPFVQQALSQIVATASSSLYHPLLEACAGYLSSFSPSHAKAACVLIDLCSGVLAPWVAQVIAKIDLAIELLEDLLGIIQGTLHSVARARAALKYIVLALSGHMDDILGKYKEVKHKILFLVEMLEPFLDPAIYTSKSRIAFGDVSFSFVEKEEEECLIVLDIIRTAVLMPAVLPSLESEWRRGSVAPSVLLSILQPNMKLPPQIDLCKPAICNDVEHESSNVSSSVSCYGGASKCNIQDDPACKMDIIDATIKMDAVNDVSMLFAPPELRTMTLIKKCGVPLENFSDSNQVEANSEPKDAERKCTKLESSLVLDAGFASEYYNLQADYFQLMNFRDCELKASEFRSLASDLHSRNEIPMEAHNAAIDALLLAAECYVNPYFLVSLNASPNIINYLNIRGAEVPKVVDISELKMVSEKNDFNCKSIAHLEKSRDKIVLILLIEAAELDRNYHEKLSGVECDTYDEQILKLAPVDVRSADAITLVRQNQHMLCKFLIKQLQGEQHSMHEILVQCLVFLLHSATKLYCSPEHVIDIILQSGDYLNGMLSSLYSQLREGKLPSKTERIHRLQRRWILLQRLVIASSGSGVGSDFAVNINNTCQNGSLIPPTAWIQKIATFSQSTSPLVRFLGWMAVSRIAKQFVTERLFLTSDLSELTYLLSIFEDELAAVDTFVDYKHQGLKTQQLVVKPDALVFDGFTVVGELQRQRDRSFHVIYPDLSKFFPNMKRQFEAFGETILEAVGLQLRSLSSTVLPDILCWFSDFCSWSFFQKGQTTLPSGFDHLKGYVAKNARAIILYLLEAIVTEHMEAMVPEIPRVVQVLISLCRASYCNVSFLDSILHLLKPIISYSLHKVSDEEKLFIDDSCRSFESLCFDELFIHIKERSEDQDGYEGKVFSRALTIFVLASVFPDLSFQRRKELLRSLTLWADFTAFEPSTSFHDYLCAFQRAMDNCNVLLVQTLKVSGFIPLQLAHTSDSSLLVQSSSESFSRFLADLLNGSSATELSDSQKIDSSDYSISNEKNCCLSGEEVEDFTKEVESLISKLYPTIEQCWSIHHQLAKTLTITLAQCFVYSRCLHSAAQMNPIAEEDSECSSSLKSVDQGPSLLKAGLHGLGESILKLQDNHCWEVASVMLNCLCGVPLCFPLDDIESICSAINRFSMNAPKLVWRLQTDRWLSALVKRGIHSLPESKSSSLVDLFSAMLGHPEPEQRLIALQHLSELVGQDTDGGIIAHCSTFGSKIVSPSSVQSTPEQILLLLVFGTWDQVALLASSDTSLPLRTHAMALLVDFMPLAARPQLQSFLSAADGLLCSFGRLAFPICEGPLLQLSLALLAGACLYSPAEDITLIPQSVWEIIETLGSKNEHRLPDLEKRACQVLSRLRNEGDDVKEVLKEVLSSNASNQNDPEFRSTRESVLQVLANLTSLQSYFDIFAKKADQEAKELEEAELELNILKKENTLQESPSKGGIQIPCLATPVKDDDRLQHIKGSIRSLEKSKLHEDIKARRQKKVLMRRDRQKYLEEAALREAELLLELDRERAVEAEKEIERQRLLDLERAKTRELRHNFDIEKEKQAQRELQRELEQAESGLRSSRRDFTSASHPSRPRDRFRERDNGRSSTEGSTRDGTGSLQLEGSHMPTVMLSGSRSFSGHLPTILQSRDRFDDCGSNYDENFDGSRDSGDTGSVGDPELVSAFDGQSGGFGSAQRQVSRGSRSRQVVERRERDGRRDGGKWERKH